MLNILSRYNWRSVAAYPSGAAILEAPVAAFGQSYFAHDFPMRSPRVFSVFAPPYGRTRDSYPAKKAQQANLGSKTGAAPTAGVYTGLSKGGLLGGGNPY